MNQEELIENEFLDDNKESQIQENNSNDNQIIKDNQIQNNQEITDDNNQEQQNQELIDQENEQKQEENRDKQIQEWNEEYNNIRHEIFNMKFDVKKMLSLNCTTQKYKHEVLQAHKHEERKDFDREIERADIFKQIKQMRYKTQFLKDELTKKNQKAIQQNKFKYQRTLKNIQFTQEELKTTIETFKEQQIQNFENLADDEEQLILDLEKMDVKLMQNFDTNYSSKSAYKMNSILNQKPINEQEISEEDEEYYDDENDFEPYVNDTSRNNQKIKNESELDDEEQQEQEENNFQQQQQQWEQVGVKKASNLMKIFNEDDNDIENKKSKKKIWNNESFDENENNDENEDLEDSIDQIIKNDQLYEKQQQEQIQKLEQQQQQQQSSNRQQNSKGFRVGSAKKKGSYVQQQFQKQLNNDNNNIDNNINFNDNEQQHQQEQEQNDIDPDSIQGIEKQMEDVKEKINKLDKQIKANGGINCGWKAQDHQDFLKVKNKHNNNMDSDQFWEEYSKFMGFFDESELKNHMQKYMIYYKLENEKKQELQQYKQLKDQKQYLEKQEKQEKGLKDNLKKQQKMQKQIMEREKKKMELEQWKQQKQKIQLQSEEEKSLQDFKRKQKLKEEKIKEQHKLQKQMVKEYQEVKDFKKMQEQKRLLEQKLEKKPTISYETKLKIRQREENHFTKQMTKVWGKKYKKEDEEMRKQELMERKNLKYMDVESKLLQKTTAAESKQNQKFDNQIDRFSQKGDNFAGFGVRQMGKKLYN